MLSDAGTRLLVGIARKSLQAAVRGGEFVPGDPGLKELQARCGCFVTYKTHGRLRGCIGCFTSSEPLYLTVARYAVLSATGDPRFAGDRLREDELGEVELDISVLSPLAPCDEPLEIELGRHGIYVSAAGRSGCFLPQVATETGWTKEQFWENCCSHKSGLRPDAWRTGDAELYTFTAEVIADPAH